MSTILILLLCIGPFFAFIECQNIAKRDDKASLSPDCQFKKNCSECIQAGCKWCTEKNVEKRCFFDNANIKGHPCNKFEDPLSASIMVDEAQGSSVRPSHVHIKLRPGLRHKLNVSMVYKDEANRPLDLYILMDLSCTMAVHKDKVVKLAGDLATSLKNLTKELRMGFGSFVDKPVLPFAREFIPSTLNCNDKTLPYVKPHLFKNQLSLTTDIPLFTKTVNEAKIMTNIDVPEGGLDALMQAVVCKNELNWREGNNTRRLIVISTDGPFHIAGDGKLLGIILPNDGKCHLNKEREYDKATTLDYPSVSQIRDRIQQNNIFVIFAVTSQHKLLYRKLAKKIGSDLASVSVITEDDSSSITKVIEQEYQKVVQSVKFQPIPTNPYVDVTYFAKCPGWSDYQQTAGCDNLTPNSTVDYLVELSLKECSENKSSRTTEVTIRPSTSGNANGNFLTIKIDMICECGCETERVPSLPSPLCNNNGTEQCGICKCHKGIGGPFCNCSISGESLDQENCRLHDETCSNRGACICGKCECNTGFIGDHCECTEKEKCPLESGDQGVCNRDLSQGTCTCRGCNCTSGVTGNRCECPDAAIAESRCRHLSKLCSDSGKCVCGECDCQPGHHGKYCEFQFQRESAFTTFCKSSTLKLVEPCIKCLSFDNVATIRLNSCSSDCGSEAVGFIKPKLQEKIDPRRLMECEGKVIDERGCEVQFIVSDKNLETLEIHVRAEQSPVCPPEAAIVPIVLGVLGVILLIGIGTLLLWKIITYIHDKKEFTRFENERSNAAWSMNQNPLYKGTVSEFQNPAYSTDNFDD